MTLGPDPGGGPVLRRMSAQPRSTRSRAVRRSTPPAVPHLVDRPRLHALLAAALDLPVTLIAAAAGWGKTVTAASWAEARAAGRAVAWVRLTKADDDPRTFWHAVAAALAAVAGQRVAEELPGATTGDVPADDLPAAAAAALLLAQRPVVLVLDDMQEITSPGVHRGLLELAEQRPPQLRLLVMTRRDPPWPLERLRLAGVVADIGAAELAFRSGEAAELFAQLQVELDATRLATLVARTEGWPAGLRLAATRLKDGDDVEHAVADFSGADQGVAGYLATEVLDTLRPELVSFLQQTSVVDLVCADLADTMTGERDAAQQLAELAASHVIVAATGLPGRWYRPYLLITDILRAQRVPRRERRDLHRRAAHWFRRNDMPLAAIRSTVAGHLWPFAADLAGAHAFALVMSGLGPQLEKVLAAVPRAVLDVHPELAGALACSRVAQGEDADVAVLIEHGRAAADARPGRAVARARVLLDVGAGGLARLGGDFDGMVSAYRSFPAEPEALALQGMAGAEIVPVAVSNDIGTAAFWVGDLAAAEHHLTAAVRTELDGFPLAQLNASAYLSLLRAETGELDRAEAMAGETIERAKSAGPAGASQTVAAYLTMARVALDRGDPDRVDEWLGEVESAEPHVQLMAAVLRAEQREAAGDREAGLAGLRMQAIGGWHAPPALHEWSSLTEAMMAARSGDAGAALDRLEGLGPVRTAAGVLASARLSLLVGDVPGAVALRARVAPPVHVRGAVQLALFDTLLAGAAGDEAQALQRLEVALAAAVPWSLRRPFLVETTHLQELLERRVELGTVAPAFAVDLLERMSNAPDSATRSAPVGSLTLRERTVLRYLASALSNAEIAAELYVSLSTLKTHQRAIYRKLGATGRRDAVRRARMLHLL